jgi:hypothetical protein
MVTEKNTIDYIIDYEMGNLSDEETINLFSKLIKNGMAWNLQGHYGRTATSLIDSEYISRDGKINWDLIEQIEI